MVHLVMGILCNHIREISNCSIIAFNHRNLIMLIAQHYVTSELPVGCVTSYLGKIEATKHTCTCIPLN